MTLPNDTAPRRRVRVACAAAVAVLALSLTAVPPVPARAAEVDRVVVDAVLHVDPPLSPGFCFALGPGELQVSVKRVQDAIERRPATLHVDGFQLDPDVHITQPIGGGDTTITVPLAGAQRYCWWVDVYAPETETMSNANRGAYVQMIDLKIRYHPS